MRSCLPALLFLFILASCHRKSVPGATHTASTEATPVKPVEEKPSVVVTGDGKVVNPTVGTTTGAKVFPVTAARSFTPNQKKNLIYRYKAVPPMVLNVPESLAKTNAKGTYYVYKKKFWYWKKGDGYFYLDETYYN
jgi:hypothetical protein